MELKDCVLYPASIDKPCSGEVEEEWVDDLYGGVCSSLRCRAHSAYLVMDELEKKADKTS